MRWSEIISETSTAGSTASGNVATVVGGRKKPSKGSIGAGFDAGGHKGIYDAAERRKG
jgi:hypothetical protein